MIGQPPKSPLFPNTTLSRSPGNRRHQADADCRQPPLSKSRFVGGYTIALGLTKLHRRATVRQADRKSTRLNSSHANISYAVFCLKKKKILIIVYQRKSHTHV